MNIFKKAAEKAKQFFKDIKLMTRKAKRELVGAFKKEYKTKKTPSSFYPGTLITFRYDALHPQNKFDKSPLCVMLGSPRDNPKHVLGLNVHWLDEKKRVLLASLVVELLNKNKGKLVYKDIKPLIKQFKGSPILRRYAIRRVSQTVIQMPTEVYLAAASISYPEWSDKD